MTKKTLYTESKNYDNTKQKNTPNVKQQTAERANSYITTHEDYLDTAIQYGDIEVVKYFIPKLEH